MIVVFGAGGFIGTYLTDQLTKDGYDVIASDTSQLGEAYYAHQGTRYQRIDITQKEEFGRLPGQGIEAVINLACLQPANISQERYDPADFVRVNILGTLNVLEFCRVHHVPKMIYTCSLRNTQGMWAEKAGRPILESDGRALKFIGDYAMFSISESAAADCVEHYAQTYDMDGVVLRLPPVYGYGPHTEIFKDGKPLKTGFQVFIEQAEQSRPIELWGDAESGRDIVYVKDVVAAVALVIKTPGVRGLYNIASGRRLSLREQVESIIRVFSPEDNPSAIRHRPDQPNLIETYVYDIEKAWRRFGWRPRYSFEDMLVDYRKEAESGRFAFLVEKRRLLMQGASHA